jgi:hypothetical protein
MPESDVLAKVKHRPGNVTASWIFGGALLAFLIVIVFVLDEPSSWQLAIIRFIMALAAAFLAYFFVGGVVLKMTKTGVALGATGGFVFFVLIEFVVNPFDLKTTIVDIAPSIVRTDSTVVAAQRDLATQGFYKGPITGKADSKTRESIRQFQLSKKLPVSGYLLDDTRKHLVGR